MRTPLIAGNWKMHHGGASACDLAGAIKAQVGAETRVEVVVAPPFTALAAVAHELLGSRVGVAAQNFHPAPQGAFTGEVSAGMLRECGVAYVIVGHSERRQLFGEVDADVALKVRAALANDLRPIACVGETLAEREAGATLEVVARQLAQLVSELAARPGYGVVAYEPVWAIGTGRVAGPAEAQEVHAAIRATLAQASQQLAETTRILYGGSVKADNAAALLGCADIDGALVGGASLEAAGFSAIVRAGLAQSEPRH